MRECESYHGMVAHGAGVVVVSRRVVRKRCLASSSHGLLMDLSASTSRHTSIGLQVVTSVSFASFVYDCMHRWQGGTAGAQPP